MLLAVADRPVLLNEHTDQTLHPDLPGDLLEASARDALGEPKATGRALERGLDLAEPHGLLAPFLLHPAPELLERHARQRTAHPALLRKIISVPCGRTPAAPAASPPEQLPEQLSQAEARVLRFLQTSLSAPEIARELYVSVNTVRTHMRHLYDKLGAHRRLEAVDRARALGLLGPVPQRALTLTSHTGTPPISACRVERRRPPVTRYRLSPFISAPSGSVPVQAPAATSPSATSASIA
jgi:DNA-binding CsgD family transcriptional regulator